MLIRFLCRRYIPSEAWTNRILAYAKGLMELGCEVELYYLISDVKRSHYEIPISGVKVINLWEKDNMLECKFRVLSYLHNLIRFRNIIRPGDKVFVYGAEKMLLKASFKKHVDVYAEITEHPYAFNNKGVRGERRIDKQSRSLNALKGLFVISNSLKEYFCSIGIDARKVCISNMIVDSNRFKIRKDPDLEPYIAYCGVISIDKDGVDTLIKSFAIFHGSHPKYKLYIIGRFGSNQIKETLEKLIEELKIRPNVVFTGQVTPDEMPKLLVNASILALARPNNIQSQNGFPTKLGEYLSTGNPVVVTSVGEIPKFIKDGYNAYLSEPDNPEDFALNLCRIADNYGEAIVIGKRGKELAENEFSYKSQSKVVYDFIALNNNSKL